MEHLNELTSSILGSTSTGASIENKLLAPTSSSSPSPQPSSTVVPGPSSSSSSSTTGTTTTTTTVVPEGGVTGTVPDASFSSATAPSVEIIPNVSTDVIVPTVPDTAASSSPTTIPTTTLGAVDNVIAVNSSVVPIMVGNSIATAISSSSSTPMDPPPTTVDKDEKVDSSSPPSNMYDDNDTEWLSLYGPSVFQSAVLQGKYRIYKSIESGALYYVNVQDNNAHTWDCPMEVAIEMKRKALESTLDEYAYEGLGADFETNGPWVPPSPTKAVAYRSANVFGGGRTSCCCFRDDDFAQLGVGVALYFRTLKALVAIFAVLTILSLPSWAFYSSGNRVTGSVPDPLKFVRVSLGNIGALTYEEITGILTTREQLAQIALASASNGSSSSGSSSSTLSLANSSGSSSGGSTTYSDSELLHVPYFSLPEYDLEVDGLTVAYTITAFDLGGMLLFLIFLAILRGVSERFIAYAERKNVSAADYTIFVKGLPSDVTVEELRDHFSSLFALDGSGADKNGKWDASKHAMEVLYYDGSPSTRHLRKNKSWSMGNKSNRVVPFNEPIRSNGGGGGGQYNPPAVKSINTAIDTALSVPNTKPNIQLSSSAIDTVVLPSPVDDSYFHQHFAIPTDTKKLKAAALAARRTIDTRRRKGIITDADHENHFTSRIEVIGKGVVTDISHNNDATFSGSWVADISLVRPVNNLLSAYLSAQELAQKLREARARVKMWSPGTPHVQGANPAKRDAAMKQVDKLGSELAALRDSLKKKDLSIASVESTCVGSAFVTFNCEESLQRCLHAYHGSTSTILRTFQSAHLRLRCPMAPGFHGLPGQEVITDEKGKIDWKLWYRDQRSNYGQGYTLRVTKAPDPSDVIHENLAISSMSRFCRQTCTGLITFLLVIIGLVMMIIAQSYSKLLATSTPDLSLCSAEIPALYFGGYTNVTEAGLALLDGYGQPSNLESSLTIQARRRRLQAKYGMMDRTLPMPSSSSSSALPYTFSVDSTTISSSSSLPTNPSSNRRRLATDNTNPSASSIMLTRLSSATDRSVEDDLCPSDRVAIAYRYNFSDIPYAVRSDYPSVPYTSTTPSNNMFNLGTSIPYTTSSHVSTVCDLSQAQAIVSTVDPSLTVRNTLDPGCPDPRLLKANEGFCPCIAKKSDRKCLTLPCFKPELEDETHKCREFTSSTIVGCYCVDTLNAYIETLGAVQGFIAYTDREGDVCESFITSYIQAQSLIIVSAAAASIINILLGLIIPALTSVEGHASLSSRSRALAVKVAAAQTINTGLTALLVNARLPKTTTYQLPSIVSTIGLLNGQFDDFTTPWYGVVGTTICTTALINTLIPPLLMSLEYILDSCRRSSALRHPGTVVTQAAMDELYVGATFETPRRYPLMITMVSVSLMYSAGFPLLLPLACFGFLLQYSVDKLMILRFYRKPPAYDASMTRLLLGIMPYVVLVHCAFAFWMLSSPAVLPSGMLTPDLILKLLASVGVSTSSFTGDTASVTEAAAAYGLSEEEIANTVAATFFAKYTALVGDYDAVGILPRLLRLNTFPYFLFLLIVFVLITLSNVLYTLYSLIMLFLRSITCGFICCSGRGGCGHSEGFDINSLRKQTHKMLSSVLHSYLDHPHLSHAIHYLTEFKAHARAFATFNRVRAGLLFEALFVRMIKDTEAEEKELFQEKVYQRKEEIRQEKLRLRAEKAAQVRAELAKEALENQTVLPPSGTTEGTETTTGNTVLTTPAPIILIPTHPVGTDLLSSSDNDPQAAARALMEEEAENAAIIKEVKEKNKHLIIHKGPPLLLDGETTGLGKGLAPFTQEFSRIHDTHAAGAYLTFAEIDAGWRLQEVDARTLDDRHGLDAAYNRAILSTALDLNVAPKGTKEFLENKVPDASLSLSKLSSSGGFLASSTTSHSNSLSTVGSPVLDTLRTKSHRYRTNRKLLLPPVVLKEVETLEDKKRNKNKSPSSTSKQGKGSSPSSKGLMVESDVHSHDPNSGSSLDLAHENHSLAESRSASTVAELTTPTKGTENHAHTPGGGEETRDTMDSLFGSSSSTAPSSSTHITEWKNQANTHVSNDILDLNHAPSALRSKVSKLFLESIFYLRKLRTVDESHNPKALIDMNNSVVNGSNSTDLTSSLSNEIQRASTLGATLGGGDNHKEPGYAKRTWEVIRDAGLYSYDVQKNPRYTNAFAIAKAGEMEDEEDERIAQEKLKQSAAMNEAEVDQNRLVYEASTSKWAGDANIRHHRSHQIDDEDEIGMAADV